MISTQKALRCAAYLKDYCLGHEFCKSCKLPKMKNGNCISPLKWEIPEIYNYPKIISEEEFQNLFISDQTKFYQAIGQLYIDLYKNKVNRKFWTKSGDEFIGIKNFKETVFVDIFSNSLDVRRFLSGWSKEDIEEFHDLEKDGLIQEEQESTSEIEEREEMEPEKISLDVTLREFCLHHTKARELVAVTDSGYIVSTVWIDYEDLFAIPEKLSNKKIKSHYWSTLAVVDANGNRTEIPAHYVEIEY